MTRWLSAAAVAMLTLSGLAWLWNQLDRVIAFDYAYKFHIQLVVVFGLLFGLGYLFFTIFNKVNVVDFLIETEGEMRKVNWPPRKDTVKLTWIVICGTFMMAAILFVIDLVFAAIQQNFLLN
jgi:preprotein translocase subunit SecE